MIESIQNLFKFINSHSQRTYNSKQSIKKMRPLSTIFLVLLLSLLSSSTLFMSIQSFQIDMNDNNDQNSIFSYNNHLSFDENQLKFNQLNNFLIHKTKRLYFHLNKRTENLTFTVQLCSDSSINPTLLSSSTTIRFELYFINLKTLKKFQKRKINRRSNKRNIQRVWNRMIDRKLSKKNYRKFLVLEYSLKQHDSGQTFGYGVVFQPGIYVLQIEKSESSEYANNDYNDNNNLMIQLYLNTKSILPYPQLPMIATIMVKQMIINANNQSPSIEVWWNPVVISSTMDNYEYCLLLQQDYRMNLQCMPLLINEGDSKMKKFCTNETKIILNDLSFDKLYYIDVFVRNNRINGLQSKYWTTNFTLIRPQQQPRYHQQNSQKFFEHQQPSSSSTIQLLHDSLFTGINLDSKNRYRKRFLYKYTSMKYRQNDHRIIDNQKIYIYIQPCEGLGPIQMNIEQISLNYFDQLQLRRKKHLNDQHRNHRHSLNRRQYEQYFDDNSLIIDEIVDDFNNDQDNSHNMLFFEEIMETRTIELTIPDSFDDESHTGIVYLIIELNTVASKQTRSVVLLITNSLTKFPFPRLPNDKSIRVMETLKQCDSITLVWNASPDERVTYCILQRDSKLGHGFAEPKHLCRKIHHTSDKLMIHRRNSNSINQTINENDNNMFDDRYQNEHLYLTRKVLCRRYRTQKRIDNHLIMQQIKKLQPNRQYIFMVTIKNRKNQLNYEQIYAETKSADECVSIRRNNYQNIDDDDDVDYDDDGDD